MKIKSYPDVADFKRESLANSKVNAAYASLAPRYVLIRQVIDARLAKRMSQKALAVKMGTKQSAIARFESGNTNPTVGFLERLSQAMKTPITISFPG